MLRRIRTWLHERPKFGKRPVCLVLDIKLVLSHAEMVTLRVTEGETYDDRLKLEQLETRLLEWFASSSSPVFTAAHLTIRRHGLVAMLCVVQEIGQ